MAKVLWAADRQVPNLDDSPASGGTVTIRAADTTDTVTAYTDRGLTAEQSVFTIGSDGWIENRPTIYGQDDVGYDAYVEATGQAARTIPDLAIADSSASDATEAATAFKNLLRNSGFTNWAAGSSFSNISGDNDGDVVADAWYFAQPSAASNAVSRQTALRTGARYGLRFGRPAASASTNKLRLWQMLATEEAIRCRGQRITLSFNAHRGADFSGTTVEIKIATGTSEGEDGDLIESGGMGGHAAVLTQAQALGTSTARFEFQADIGASVGEIGIQFAFTGAGSAGANDWVQIEDVQIEIADTATAYEAPPEAVEYLRAGLTTGGRAFLSSNTTPSAFALTIFDDVDGPAVRTTIGAAASATSVATSLTLTAGLGISGGGDLSSNRSFAFDPSELTDTSIATGDGLVFMDVSDANNPKRRTVSSFLTDLSIITSSNLLAGILAVDGSGSGIDADTVDGVQAASIAQVGKQSVWISAAAMTPRITNGAAPGIMTLSSGVDVPVLDFDSGTQEHACFTCAMPKSWNEGTVSFTPYWTAAGGTPGQNCRFALEAFAASNDDALSASLGSDSASDDTHIANGDLHIGPESGAITIGGSPAENDMVCFNIRRQTASDNMAGDARLIGIMLHFTTNAPNDA